MKSRFARFPPLVASLAALTLSAACSGSDGNSGDARPGPSLTPLNRACGGIFGKSEVADVLSAKKGQNFKKGATSSGSESRQVESVARSLSKDMYVMDSHTTCFLDDPEPDGAAKMQIYFEWWPVEFSKQGAKQGESAVYKEERADMPALYVDCKRGDLVAPGRSASSLRAVLVDRLGLSRETKEQLLIASAQKVTSKLKCENSLNFPESPQKGPGSK